MILVKLSIFLPLLSALISGIFATKGNIRFINFVSTTILITTAILSIILFIDVTTLHQDITYTLFPWISVADFNANWSLKIDSLSATMILVVNSVSAIVHCYSLGYMKHDSRINRFITYISLFTFFMLILVTSANLLQLFVGWEGVGLCSYLLIGFWYKKESANKAAMKAFIINRIGDFAFLIGIIALYMLFGSLYFDDIFTQVYLFADVELNILFTDIKYLDFVCMMLFIGCMGKSAQLGLHTWLPDAMEGPTPVSALIHAATMVTAGVFLVVRCSPLFEYSPFTLQFITIIGGLTCIYAATVAITQNDIKKIIAYSTCSQLGYMFFACGVSAYAAGMFHLVTHAFFKALLFLAAGNVIIAMHHKNDIREMGGLWKKLPYTYILFWVGSLAISGIPPLSGYYSKDAILESAFMSNGDCSFFAYIVGLITVFLTAFYSWRLIYIVFHGTAKSDQPVERIPKTMSLPLIFLALGAICVGYIGYHYLHVVESASSFWQKSIFVLHENDVLEKIHHTPPLIKYLPLITTISGITLATIYYIYNKNLPKLTMNSFHSLYKFFHGKWFFDELYVSYIVKPYMKIAKFNALIIDKKAIDNFGPNGLSSIVNKCSKLVSKLHTGFIYHYAFSYITGIILILSWLFWKTVY